MPTAARGECFLRGVTVTGERRHVPMATVEAGELAFAQYAKWYPWAVLELLSAAGQVLKRIEAAECELRTETCAL